MNKIEFLYWAVLKNELKSKVTRIDNYRDESHAVHYNTQVSKGVFH